MQQLEPEGEKRTAALRLAREVVESREYPSNDTFNEVREAGYSDEQIMEMDRHRVPCYLY
jgi:alkylhydroperoxidase family enzyme